MWRWHLLAEAALAVLLVPIAILDYHSTCSEGRDWISLPCHGWLIMSAVMLFVAEGALATTAFALAWFVQRDQSLGRLRVVATLVLPHVAALLALHLTTNLPAMFVDMMRSAI